MCHITKYSISINLGPIFIKLGIAAPMNTPSSGTSVIFAGDSVRVQETLCIGLEG